MAGSGGGRECISSQRVCDLYLHWLGVRVCLCVHGEWTSVGQKHVCMRVKIYEDELKTACR